MRPLALSLALLAWFVAVPAAAAETAAVALPWGDALLPVLQGLASAAVPFAAAAVTALVARLAGPLRLFVTATLVERLVRNVTDFALNAVAGAVKGRTLTIPLGSAVIARAVQRAADQAPGWLLRQAGGIEGLAEKVFRSLPLEEAATVGNTLRPAVEAGRRLGATRRPAG
ncbi:MULTISPECIES: hypothetical protein [Methylobacterium]|uniref:Uncharacterized protein n=2 Tax=Pseudomonadota TaxID=1224 RepID=A0ABQ4SQM0_9HYPH|nr:MULTISPECIES: hypothetical protein [Methylobacterium]PIU07439.1 MAG: hypothetical protein COT56_05080 [Methylobacterium sp. CG09_land_8_20_14_0_10_71_15]PIU13975.1 MAG: hypothetical protein COT28_09545 [Methylobacterium sp. CG08_land_8_20_14_0_20_71_15]GBU17325.1 hypothetical protein AwMethylo_15400 [Methylobacterium sp.]GJE05519.1 hypothetical protein AOPFMNJM_0819 [Methylobacterium jeotgali]